MKFGAQGKRKFVGPNNPEKIHRPLAEALIMSVTDIPIQTWNENGSHLFIGPPRFGMKSHTILATKSGTKFRGCFGAAIRAKAPAKPGPKPATKSRTKSCRCFGPWFRPRDLVADLVTNFGCDLVTDRAHNAGPILAYDLAPVTAAPFAEMV